MSKPKEITEKEKAAEWSRYMRAAEWEIMLHDGEELYDSPLVLRDQRLFMWNALYRCVDELPDGSLRIRKGSLLGDFLRFIELGASPDRIRRCTAPRCRELFYAARDDQRTCSGKCRVRLHRQEKEKKKKIREET